MKKIVLTIFALFLGVMIYWYWQTGKSKNLQSPSSNKENRPLDVYTIDNLSKRKYNATQINLEKVLDKNKNFTSYLFSFESDGKRVTGQANIPKNSKRPQGFPVIAMFRGYIDEKEYTTGAGTKNAAAFFATGGYLTLAPDFLGYGGSDPNSNDILESRFQTYTVALNLLASIKTLKEADLTKIGIWGHSNGGQIALTVLTVTQNFYPTVLWAPVSKPFPYSVLYYTDESSDRGKLIRKKLAEFESLYDADLFSYDLYINRIQATIQLDQGTADDAVPQKWSDSLADNLKKMGKNVNYLVYRSADHNMRPLWNTVIQNDLVFFNKYLMRE